MSTQVLSPFPLFTSLIGAPLTLGYVYIGVANQDPETHPQQAYWDEGLTTPAAQPLRTNGGYVVNAGNAATVYTSGAFSIRVRDKNGVLVFYRANIPNADALRDELESDAGAGLVGFSHAETYPTGTLGAKGRDTVSVKDAPFNAKGDGVTDDTAAIQAALDTDKDVFFPAATAYYKISSRLQTSVNGQRIYGTGLLSRIVQTGTNNNANVFTVAHTDCEFTGLALTPATATLSSLGHGWGIAGTAAHRTLVHDIRVSGMRRGGVSFFSSNNCVVRGNVFTDSVIVNPSPTDPAFSQANMGYDIFFAESSSYNIAEGNQCVSGCGVGVGCQTVTGAGVTQRANTIRGNIIRNHPCYGVMLYLSGGDTLIASHIVEGNFISDISGSVYTGGTSLFYGAGIYSNSAQGIVVSNNKVFATNTDRSLPRSGSDVPAAIGVSGYGNATVSGNNIAQCYHGIMTIQTLTNADGEGAVITGNYVLGADFNGIFAIDAINTIIGDNRVLGSNTGANGIMVQKVASSQMDCTSIVGNYVRDFTAGIVSLDGPPEFLVNANTVRDASTYGIYSTSPKTLISNNDVAATTTGVNLSAGVTRGIVADNIVVAATEISNSSTGAQLRGNKFSIGLSVGSSALVAGTVTVNTAEVRTGDKIMLSRGLTGGTPGHLSVGTITNGTSFVINASGGADTSTINWEILH